MTIETIKKRQDFLAARNAPTAGAKSFLLVRRDRGDDKPARFGFTVTRKIGNAVVRNRVRRRLKESVRLTLKDHQFGQQIDVGADYILIARRPALTISFERLLDDVKRGLLRLSTAPK